MPGSGLDIRLYPDELRTIDSASFSGSYQAVGSPLTFAARVVKFTNQSGVDVLLSWDGSTDNEIIPSKGFVLLDISANRETANQCAIAANTQFYVNGSASTGNFYISVYYAT